MPTVLPAHTFILAKQQLTPAELGDRIGVGIVVVIVVLAVVVMMVVDRFRRSRRP